MDFRKRDIEVEEVGFVEELPMQSNDTELPVELSNSDMIYYQIMQKGSDIVSKMADAYMENKRINANIETLRLQTNTIVKMHAERIALARECVTNVFCERSIALSKHYNVLDKAIAENDKQLMISALQGISSIVVENPLEQIAGILNSLTNKDTPLLLDF